MVGADETTELWRPPIFMQIYSQNLSVITNLLISKALWNRRLELMLETFIPHTTWNNLNFNVELKTYLEQL